MYYNQIDKKENIYRELIEKAKEFKDYTEKFLKELDEFERRSRESRLVAKTVF